MEHLLSTLHHERAWVTGLMDDEESTRHVD